MTSQVLYRKWRPPRFADIVGQEPVTQTLMNAVASSRTSHAYLFCGPRGTGKTSTARVLAKSMNCTMRPPGVGDPCGACDHCRAIDNGSFIDLIEIDAASHRGIEDMQKLTEKVRYAPTLGKTKVYIIDEAHQLTRDGASAFLKTLEEPPPNTVFVLATTDPQRLLGTIISRCQRLDFHRIAPSDVIDRLGRIAQEEGVDASPEVLRLIARSASGSLRDATNLLDQLITSVGTHIGADQVRDLLGIGGEERALALVKHLLAGNTTQALEVINAFASDGLDLRPLHHMTVDFLRAALLLKSGVSDGLDLSKDSQSQLSFTASSVPIEQVMRALHLFGHASLGSDIQSPLPLELATVELGLESTTPTTTATPGFPSPAPQEQAPRRESSPAVSRSAQPASTPTRPAPQPAQSRVPAPQTPMPAVVDPSAPADQRLIAQWPDMLKALSRVPRRRFDVAALLRSSASREVEGTSLVVRFTHQSNSERLQHELEDPRCRIEVEKILQQALGDGFTLRIEGLQSGSAAASANEASGHLVRAAMNLGGQVVSQSETPPDTPAEFRDTMTPEPPFGNGGSPVSPVALVTTPPYSATESESLEINGGDQETSAAPGDAGTAETSPSIRDPALATDHFQEEEHHE